MATYKNEKDAAKEVDKAAKKGWMPQGTTATDGHINVGRTVTGAVLTGGLNLLIGGSRSKGKVTITYVRTPEWLEKIRKPAAPKEESVPEDIAKTFSDGEIASMVISEDAGFKMHLKKLIITNKRAIIYKPNYIGADIEEFSLDSISNIDVKKGIAWSDIIICAGHGEGKIKHVFNDNAEKGVITLRNNMQAYKSGQKEASAQLVSPEPPKRVEVNITDEIKKLVELKTQGALTEEEFAEAKRKLLDKL